MAILKSIIPKDKKLCWNEYEKVHAYSTFFVLLLVAVLATDLFWYAPIPRVDFYDELWGPAHLLLQGKSPYDTASLNPMQPAAWFPMAIGFYFPLGWLGEDNAAHVWLIINIIELCMLIYIAQGKERLAYGTLILAVLCFFFPPALHHFALGQISITVVLCLVLSVHFVNKDQPWMAAFLIALAFSKPHISILPALGLCYHHLLNKKGKVILFLGRILLMVLILCIPLFVAFPNWIPDAIKSMSKIPFWEHPSLFVFLPEQLGNRGYIAWGLVAAVSFVFCYFQWKYYSPRKALYWSLALSSLVSPYIGSWDFVALFPLLILTFTQIDWKRKLFVIISYGAAWRLMALVQMQHGGLNYYFWWVPLWFIVTLAFVTNWRISKVTNNVRSYNN